MAATTQFTARAADAEGVRVENPAVTWRSSNPGVVRVDDTGLATAVANGTATITAQVDDVTGDAPATVCTQPLPISISAGQYAEVPVGCPLLIPSGAPADRYRVAIVRLSAAAEAAPKPEDDKLNSEAELFDRFDRRVREATSSIEVRIAAHKDVMCEVVERVSTEVEKRRRQGIDIETIRGEVEEEREKK